MGSDVPPYTNRDYNRGTIVEGGPSSGVAGPHPRSAELYPKHNDAASLFDTSVSGAPGAALGP